MNDFFRLLSTEHFQQIVPIFFYHRQTYDDLRSFWWDGRVRRRNPNTLRSRTRVPGEETGTGLYVTIKYWNESDTAKF